MGFADALRSQGKASGHLFPRGKRGHGVWGPHLGWPVSLGMLVPVPKNLSVEEAAERDR